MEKLVYKVYESLVLVQLSTQNEKELTQSFSMPCMFLDDFGFFI